MRAAERRKERREKEKEKRKGGKGLTDVGADEGRVNPAGGDKGGPHGIGSAGVKVWHSSGNLHSREGPGDGVELLHRLIIDPAGFGQQRDHHILILGGRERRGGLLRILDHPDVFLATAHNDHAVVIEEGDLGEGDLLAILVKESGGFLELQLVLGHPEDLLWVIFLDHRDRFDLVVSILRQCQPHTHGGYFKWTN